MWGFWGLMLVLVNIEGYYFDFVYENKPPVGWPEVASLLDGNIIFFIYITLNLNLDFIIFSSFYSDTI